MTCKDCIHDGVCYLQEVTNDIDEQLREFGCEDFKNKADLVEVVRCKDCEHYYDGRCYVANRSPLFKYDVNIHSCKEYDFCSYGERRDT